MDEQEIVRLARSGDRAAFAALARAHGPLVLSLAACYVGRHDASDAAQEIWLAVWQKLWQLENGDAFLPWLRKVAYYHCLNYRKVRGRRQQRELALGAEAWLHMADYVADESARLDELMLHQDLQRQLSGLLDDLPGDYGLLLRLRYFRELDLAEIVALTDLPLTTVKWRLHEGRRLLRSKIAVALTREGRYS